MGRLLDDKENECNNLEREMSAMTQRQGRLRLKTEKMMKVQSSGLAAPFLRWQCASSHLRATSCACMPASHLLTHHISVAEPSTLSCLFVRLPHAHFTVSFVEAQR
jgi:hypothetical protein